MFVVCSKLDNSLKKAKMFLQDDCAKIILAEDFVKNFKKYNFSNNNNFYILCKCKYNKKITNILSKYNAKIINKQTVENQISKFEIQTVLQKNNICVPNILQYDNLTKSSFPVFCKGKRHSYFNATFFDLATFDNFFKKFSKKQFYIETFVNNAQKEKAYFVNTKIFVCNNTNCDKKIEDLLQCACNKISKIFDAKVFSVQYFVFENDICIFDLDFQTGIFENKFARKYFYTVFS